MSKKHLLVVLSLVLVLVLVAPVAASRTTSTDADARSQVDGMTIRIGTNAEYPPFEEIAEDGSFVGFDIDLMEALAADAGFEIEWINTRWDGIFFALGEGEFDAVISAATIRADRERIVDFTIPYFVASQSIAVQVEMAEEVVTPDDLAGLTIGVQNGTTGDFFASEIEGAEVERYDEVTLAFTALGDGSVDAVIADTPAAAAIIANQPDLNATIVGDPLTEEFYGIAVNPEMPELLDALNTSLENIFADGSYSEIYEDHFGAAPPEYLLTGDFDLDVFVVDMTDPASVAAYSLYTVFELGDLEEYAAISCEEFLMSEDAITEDDLAELEGLSIDASQLEYTTEIDGDTALVVASGNIIISDGTDSFEVPFTDIFDDDTTELVAAEDGTWLFCPAVEDMGDDEMSDEDMGDDEE